MTENTTAPFTATPGSNFHKLQESRQDALTFFKNHPEQMNLDRLIEADLDIYVRNNVSRGGRCAVDFMVNSRKHVINIPNTWIAIRLNDHMSARDISASGSLRDFLRKKALVLVHPSVAEAEYATDRGQRELSRFRSELAKAEESRTAVEAPRPSNEVSDKMKELVIELQDSTGSKRQDVLDKIFSNTRTFNISDIAYFQDKCGNDSAAMEQAAEMLILVETNSAK